MTTVIEAIQDEIRSSRGRLSNELHARKERDAEGEYVRDEGKLAGLTEAGMIVEEIAAEGVDRMPRVGDAPELEWLAWRHMCRELEAILPPGLDDVNARECEAFVAAVKRWGEELVGLRLTQGAQTVSRAREEARKDYPKGGVPIDE
jgi:hypothetical protein